MTGNSFKWLAAASQGYLPKLSLALVTTLFAYESANVTWNWISPPWEAPVYSSFKTSSSPQTSSPLSINSIVNQHLFGEVKVEEIAKPEPIKAPETRLKLELRGVISAGKESGSAIIADESKNERYYSVGDTVAGSATLHEVHPTKVILERGGRFETLSLPEESLGKGVEGSGSESVERPTVPSGQGSQIAPDTIQSIREYRDVLINEPQKLMDVIRTTPVNRGGKLYGYRIYPGADRQFMIKLGLRAGDIITSVNGIALSSPAEGMKVFQQLGTATQVSLTVDRNGTTKSFDFNLNE